MLSEFLLAETMDPLATHSKIENQKPKIVHGYPYRIAWKGRMADIPRRDWDALALPLPTPFLEWDWLELMEASGSIAPETGWIPRHLTVWSGRRLVAAAPLYLKLHSEGEFIGDYAWAELAVRMGIGYYPKLVGMSPVTPVSGYRFLVDPAEDQDRLQALMAEEIHRFCLDEGISGVSLLFVEPDWGARMKDLGFSAWIHQSFTWVNPGFRTFDDYLDRFDANARRNIKRERKAMKDQDLRIRMFVGDEIPPSFFPRMYRFYVRTNEKFGPWGCRYLTGAFFDGLVSRFRHRLLFAAAFQGSDTGQPVGMSMLAIKADRLFGRYWGCDRKALALHFNACYYAPIQWAISNGIRRFDPGAGGAHKIRRGFRSVPSLSLHRFCHPRMERLLRSNIDEINDWEQQEIDRLNRELPFSEKDKDASGQF